MLKFVLQKIKKKKWMMLALLIGNILLISIAVSNPMYSQAVMQRMLTRNLSDYLVTRNAYPGLVTVKSSSNAAKANEVFAKDEVVDAIPGMYGIDPVCEVTYYYLNTSKAVPDLVRDDDKSGKSISLGTMSDIGEHITITAGRMFSDSADEDGVIDVIVSERGLIEMDLLMGETIAMPSLTAPDGGEVRIRIVGAFTNKAEDDLYWVKVPRAYNSQAFLAEDIFFDYFVSESDPKYSMNGLWYVMLDYTAMRGKNADEMLAASAELSERFSTHSNIYTDNFTNILTNYVAQAKKVNVTLWVLQVPIFVLLAAFIFMVSRQILESEQNEISVIKSRGAGKRQIISIYLIQSVVLALIALAVGIPLGMYLCQVLGSSNAFLEFVKRKALDLEFSLETALFALAAAVFSIGAMVLPVFKFANVTIVAHKQKKNARRRAAPWWQKGFVDVILLGVSLYGLYTFGNQKALIAQQVADGASLDPLLFLSSSLFMIGAGLVALRILPVIVWAVYSLFKRAWSPALYASFLRVVRTRSSQGFITVFLILTIALGIFNAQAAQTINTNKEDNIRYTVGADLVVMEAWGDNSQQLENDPSIELVYSEPDYAKYASLLGNGADSITRVYNTSDVSMTVPGGTLKNVQVMGIHTREFGETAWFSDDLLPSHINSYLNVMSQDARAVLVSSNLQSDYGYKVGDAIYYKNRSGDSMRGVIYGFVDYWPNYAPVKYARGTDGIYKETPQYLIVAHLAQIQSSWGIQPYEVWMKLSGSSQVVYDFAAEREIVFRKFEDVSAKMVELKNDPVFQGTNGVLTVGFVVVLILCTVGFLIYWIMSIQSRTLQFGIFRAMGMSLREIVSMLINEQIFISGLAIATGALVGRLASKLYIPLIQIAYTAVDQAVPMVVVDAQSDTIRLMLIIGVMILVCLAILAVIIKNMKIAQALKLGED